MKDYLNKHFNTNKLFKEEPTNLLTLNAQN